MLNSEDIKPVALTIVNLCLAEGISWLVCNATITKIS